MEKLIKKANEFIKINKNKVNNKYRHKYHLMPKVGWLNDPNGFSIFNDEYHLFYQYHPYSAKWGPMHWGHATSSDLITWNHKPVALAPLENNALGGAPFSGTAITYNNIHYLMYTENWPKFQVQSLARSTCGKTYKILSNSPVITSTDLPKDAFMSDFRDPKIWFKNNTLYALISSKAKDKSGQLLLYKSENKLGLMWECPDLFLLNKIDVLLVSIQYLKSDNDKYNNLHPVVYMLGNLDYTTGKYTYSHLDELDSGFDFYAPQTITNKRNEQVMIAWMSMWERTVVTDELGHNWAGSMTLPRILSIKNNHLYQTPINEIKQYRYNYEKYENTITNDIKLPFNGYATELVIDIENIDASSFGIELFKSETEKTVLTYNVKAAKLILDRSNSGYQILGNKEFDNNSNIRRTSISLNKGKLRLHIFLDVSSIEVFIQDGYKTMTSLVYPKDNSRDLVVFANGGNAKFNISKWDLKGGSL